MVFGDNLRILGESDEGSYHVWSSMDWQLENFVSVGTRTHFIMDPKYRVGR